MAEYDKNTYVYLGKSVKYPVNGSFESTEGIDCLMQDLEQNILTIPGERPRRSSTGGGLGRIIWENIAQVDQNGKDLIAGVINKDPRVDLVTVLVEKYEEVGAVLFYIIFTIKKTSKEVNLVLPFLQSNRIVK